MHSKTQSVVKHLKNFNRNWIISESELEFDELKSILILIRSILFKPVDVVFNTYIP